MSQKTIMEAYTFDPTLFCARAAVYKHRVEKAVNRKAREQGVSPKEAQEAVFAEAQKERLAAIKRYDECYDEWQSGTKIMTREDEVPGYVAKRLLPYAGPITAAGMLNALQNVAPIPGYMAEPALGALAVIFALNVFKGRAKDAAFCKAREDADHAICVVAAADPGGDFDKVIPRWANFEEGRENAEPGRPSMRAKG